MVPNVPYRVYYPASHHWYLSSVAYQGGHIFELDCSSAYNAIIIWPTLNTWRAATTTYHLLVKFPTEYGIGEARGDQMVACECYIDMLEMDNHLQASNIEERWVTVEHTESLEDISLDNDHPN